MTAARLPVADTAAVSEPRSTRARRNWGELPPLWTYRKPQTPAATTSTTAPRDMIRFITFQTPRRSKVFTEASLAPPTRPIQPVERDAIVGQGLGLQVLGLGQGQLRVRQFQNRAHAGVEAALGQAKVLLGRGHRGLCRLQALLAFLDGDLGLLDVARDLEILRPGPGPARLQEGLRLAIAGDAAAAVVKGPRQGQRQRPDLVQLGPRASVRTATRDVGEEVAEGLALAGLGRLHEQAGLAALGALALGLGTD